MMTFHRSRSFVICYLSYALTFGFIQNSFSQCACTNCPVSLPNSGTAEGFLTISGATSNVLNTTQFVKAVNINVDHDAIRECEITLIAPNGSSVLLSDNSGVAVNNNITYDICILDCTGNPVPDPGFPINFTSNANYMSGQTYIGSYFTFNGACLSTLTGPVNGQWTLRFQDFVGGDGGILNDWSIELTNNDGTSCTFVCATPTDECDAEGGTLVNLPAQTVFCENDPGLQFSINPDYGGNNPDPALYTYVYLLNNTTTNQTIEYNDDQNFTDLPPGQYRVCGLSYLTEDQPDLPAINGTDLVPVITQLINTNVICADLSSNCFSFTIQPVPSPPTLTGPTEVCAGELVTYTFTNQNPTIQPVIAITSGGFGLFTVVGNQINVIWLSGPGEICISISNACGNFEECVQVIVNDYSQDFILTGQSPVCFGDEETYTLSPALPPGFTNDWTVSNGTIITGSDNTVSVIWDGSGNGEICATITDPCNTITNVCIPVTITPEAPPPVINMPLTACVDGVFTANITPSTTYTAYNWSATPAIITSGQGSPSITLTSLSPGTVTVCVEVLSDCSPSQTDCKTIEIADPPIPSIQESPLCGLEGSVNVVNPVATAVYSWTLLSGPGFLTFTSPNASATGFTASVAGTYTIQLTETINGCTGTNTIDVTLYPEISVSDISFDCTNSNGYIISFTINGGLPDYFVDNVLLTGNTFVSGFIPFTTEYNFVITDQAGCTETITGVEDCPCVSDAGTGNQTLISVCADEDATAEEVSGIFLDGNDTGVYVLHSNPGNLLGIVYATSTTPSFGYFPSLQYGTTYYISYIVGNEIAGTVDVNDPCLSVSFGQPVIFNKIPEPFAGNDIQTCENIFELNGINDVPGSDILWSVASGDNVTILNPDLLNTLVTVTESGSYILLLEENNEGCTGSDEISVTVFDQLSSQIVQTDCNLSTGEYTVTITLSGGSLPYFVNGLPITGTTFTTPPIPSGEIYNLLIEDIIDCSLQIQGTFNCDCETRGGTMGSEELTVCAEGGIVTGVYNNDGISDANDTGVYILHTGAGNILGTVLASNNTGTFSFDPTWQTNTTYYISYVIGNSVIGTVDLSDPCLGVSPGQPVIFRSDPNVVINPVRDTCSLVNVLSTTAEVGVTYSWSTTDPGIDFSDDSGFITTVTAASSGTYTVTLTASNDACTVSVSTSVTFLPLPSVQDIVYDCNDQVVYDAMVTLSGTLPFTADLPYVPVSTNVLAFDNLFSSAITPVLITSGNGCVVPVELTFDCSCQRTPGTMSTSLLPACEGDEVSAIYNFDGNPGEVDSFIYILHTFSTDILGTVLATSSDGRFAKPLLADYNTIYYISYVTVNFVNGNYEIQPCSFIAPGQPVVFYQNPVIDWSIDLNRCLPEAAFTISSTGNIVDVSLISAPQGVNFTRLDNTGFTADMAGDYVFSVEAENNGCTTIESKLVKALDSPLITEVFTDCKGLFFDVTFNIRNGSPPYFLNGNFFISTPYTTELIPGGETITLSIADSRGCLSSLLEITQECNCITDAGTLTGDEIILCDGENLNPVFEDNYVLGTGDGFTYLLHDGTAQDIGTILWEGSTFPIQFQNVFGGNKFILVRVAGPVLPDGSVLLSDDCTDFSNSIVVEWSKKPEFESAIEPYYCENREINIMIENSGTGDLEIFINQNEIVPFTPSANGIILDPAFVQNGDIISYRFTDTLGCVYQLGNDAITIQMLPEAGASSTPFASCINETDFLNLSDYLSGEDIGGSWFIGSTFLPVDGSFEVNPDITTDTILYYVVNNVCGRDTSTLEIIRHPLPEFAVEGIDPSCFGLENGTITIFPATIPTNIEINGEEVFGLTIQNLQPGEYEVRMYNEFGCSMSENITLLSPEPVEIDLGPDLLVDSGNIVKIQYVSNLRLDETGNITWTLPDGGLITGIITEITATITDTSVIQIEITDKNGCKSDDFITIYIRASEDDSTSTDDIILPNIIQPGAGQNGTFSLNPNDNIRNVKICSIYDRWGNKVYHAENTAPEAISWDGTFQGNEVMDGVYVVRLVLNMNNNRQVSIVGDLTVLSR